MDKLTIEVGAVVQHYKREEFESCADEKEKAKEPYMSLYQIVAVADMEGELIVVYKALYGNNNVYARKVKDFLSNVYSGTAKGQQHRFVKYEGKIELPEY